MIITYKLPSCYFSSYYVARPLRSPFRGRVHERHHHQGEIEQVPAGLGPLPQTWERNASISKGSRSLISIRFGLAREPCLLQSSTALFRQGGRSSRVSEASSGAILSAHVSYARNIRHRVRGDDPERVSGTSLFLTYCVMSQSCCIIFIVVTVP